MVEADYGAPDFLGIDLLDWLYDAPGIICDGSDTALLRQVLCRTAAVSVPGRPGAGGTGSASAAGGVAPARRGHIARRDRILKQRRAALGDGADMLAVMTRSDGVGAFLGSDLTLCPRVGETRRNRSLRPPRCVTTGFCHRHGASVAEVLSTSSVPPPEAIAARVLVFDVEQRGKLIP